MKKFFLLSIFLPLFFAAGCSAEEQEFLNAAQKILQSDSYMSTTEITTGFDYSENGESTENELRSLKHFFNGFSAEVSTILERGESDGAYKLYVNTITGVDPFSAIISMWAEAVPSENKFDIIIKVPELIKMSLPESYAKDYLIINYFNLLEYATGGEGFLGGLDASVFGLPRELPIDVLEEYGIAESLSGNVAIESKTTDGNKALTMKMNDKQFKDFTIAFLGQFKTNEALQKIIMDPVMGGSAVASDEMIQAGIAQLIDSMIAELKAGVFDLTTILGDGGISYTITLSPEGVPVSEEVAVNLRIDNYAVTKYATADMRTFREIDNYGVIDFNFNAETAYFDVNGEYKAELPALTDLNSVNLIEAREREEELQREETAKWLEELIYRFPQGDYEEIYQTIDFDSGYNTYSLHGEFNGEEISEDIRVSFDYPEKFSYFMHLDDATEIFGGEVEFSYELNGEEESPTPIWKTGGKEYVLVYCFYPIFEANGNLDEEEDDRFKEWLDGREIIYDSYASGEYFIDMLQVEQITGADFGYDSETNSILIRDVE